MNFSLVPGMKGTTMVMFLLLGLLSCWFLLLVLLLLVGWFWFVNLWYHWLRAQFGNWHACSAVLMCCSSCYSLSCEDETTLALWANVLNTLCFAVMWWLLSQCKYWSVWVGFLLTEVLKVLSCSMVTRVSKNGSEPCCVGSTVNWISGSWLLMCCRRAWLCSALLMTKVLSTNLSHSVGVGVELRAFTSNSSIRCWLWGGWWGIK